MLCGGMIFCRTMSNLKFPIRRAWILNRLKLFADKFNAPKNIFEVTKNAAATHAYSRSSVRPKFFEFQKYFSQIFSKASESPNISLSKKDEDIYQLIEFSANIKHWLVELSMVPYSKDCLTSEDGLGAGVVRNSIERIFELRRNWFLTPSSNHGGTSKGVAAQTTIPFSVVRNLVIFICYIESWN